MRLAAGGALRHRSPPPRAALATRAASVYRQAAARGRPARHPGSELRTLRRSCAPLSLATWARVRTEPATSRLTHEAQAEVPVFDGFDTSRGRRPVSYFLRK